MKKKIFSVIAAVFLHVFFCALLNRAGSLILLWKEEPVSSVTHDSGYGYYAFVRDENISKLSLPILLKEDENIIEQGPLSVNEDLIASIKEKGGGRWQMQENNNLYFSASDGQPEDHEYSVISPIIIRNRYLLAAAFPAGICAAVILFLSLKHKGEGILRDILRVFVTLCCLMLFFPWNRSVYPGAPVQIGSMMIQPVLQRNIFFCALFFVLVFLYIRLCRGSRILNILAVLTVLCSLFFYFIPEWNLYGQRADSPAYQAKYSASSIRTPGYPVFIEAVYKLTGTEGLAEIRAEGENIPDEDLRDGTQTDSRGMLTVVRAQKIVLAAAFLVLFTVFCRYYRPLWFMYAAQIILCGGFLGVDNSYIMTECLSQAAFLLAAAAIILTIREKGIVPFLFLCVISGIGILIRPANIFLAVPLLVCFIYLIRSRGKFLQAAAGCLVFLAIAAIPAITIYRHYGVFVWMPLSGYVEIGRAVEIMQPGDEEAFDDPELKAFCSDLLVLKQQYPDADQNTYMWQVGIAAAEAHGYDHITCSPLLGKVSRRIFLLHTKEFAASLLNNIKTALERTRLNLGPVSFTLLLCLSIVCFALRICTDSTLGMGFVLLHVIHLCLSMINQPERRYIYSTEILCLLGWLLIVISLLRTGSRRSS